MNVDGTTTCSTPFVDSRNRTGQRRMNEGPRKDQTGITSNQHARPNRIIRNAIVAQEPEEELLASRIDKRNMTMGVPVKNRGGPLRPW